MYLPRKYNWESSCSFTVAFQRDILRNCCGRSANQKCSIISPISIFSSQQTLPQMRALVSLLKSSARPEISPKLILRGSVESEKSTSRLMRWRSGKKKDISITLTLTNSKAGSSMLTLLRSLSTIERREHRSAALKSYHPNTLSQSRSKLTKKTIHLHLSLVRALPLL